MPGRIEDQRLLTGQGRYADDWSLLGQTYAAFLRADRAHAEIVGIDVAAALSAAGVLAVLTGADMAAAGTKSLPTRVAVKGRGGKPLIKPSRPSLALEKVRFVGEPVALVVAETLAQAQDALELIEVNYRDLPIVTNASAALASEAPGLHREAPDNCVLDYETGDEAATEAAFAVAKRVVRVTLDNTRVVANPMEPRSFLASFDPETRHFTVYSCTQGLNNLRNQLQEVMALEDGRLTVIAEDVGGGFGVRSNAYPEYIAVMVAAQRINRPVKWTATRSETFLGDDQARDVISSGELALDADGHFLALRFSFLFNLGAYLTQTGPVLATVGVTACLTGVYDVPIAYSRARLALTNTPPCSAYRGAGRPIMSYLLERLVDEAAVVLDIDPAELRRSNLIANTAFPYRLANSVTYDCGDFQGILTKSLLLADWNGFQARRNESQRRGRLRGRGIATYIEATAGGNTPSDQVELRFGPEGRITLYVTSHSQGQGHETTFAQVVGETLGIDPARVRLRSGDPSVPLVGNSTGGSRTLVGVGSSLLLAARTVIERALPFAAEHLEVADGDLEFIGGTYRIKGTDRSVTLSMLAIGLANRSPHPFDVRTEIRSGATYPNGCHIAEVEIDPETGETEIERYIAVDDVGNIIHPQIVEGQVMGGLAQGAGQVFGERAVFDPETGQLLSGSFMDYPMPRAGLVRGLVLKDHPVPTETNLLGAKGVGEAGVTGSLPTLMNAVADAMRSAGVAHFDMPATPMRVWQALSESSIRASVLS